ncbi:hypothetical protein INT45_004616 [Circinella minor]|uniref:Heterokaryon incompatibility domain-containing protein n=1 Tax=Circinella minor TaxID=1195481 RepID=A0A8H7S170_9FUNG|nr:hypothetical protein INT45_004616 [Circinella minor]
MYINYYRNQKSIDHENKTNFRLSLTGGEYRPTRLVRVSDWTIVPGSEALYGYHTLSYCWEQSGKIVQRDDGEYDCIDEGDHCVVDGYNITENEDTGIKRYLMRSIAPDRKTTSSKRATFEELIQQICKDFQVDYLWYDKVCIDQSNKEEKSREIKQMHKIYKNAQYTLALIPELCITKNEDFKCEHSYYGNAARVTALKQISNSRWSKRSWTLEEVMMSKRILFVGTDTNLFQHSLHTNTTPTTFVGTDTNVFQHGLRTNTTPTTFVGTDTNVFQHGLRTNTTPTTFVGTDTNLFQHSLHTNTFPTTFVGTDTNVFQHGLRTNTTPTTFVRTDTNLFQRSLRTNTIPTTYDDFSGTLLDFGGRPGVKGTINQALHHAHFRTSTKPHDMVFALINTFSHLCDEIEINYSTDIHTTFNNFYRHIALKDLSILCFGCNWSENKSELKQTTMGNYGLPSWTGIRGLHSTEPTNTATHIGLSYRIDDSMQMRITTKHWWKIPVGGYFTYKKERKNMDDYHTRIYNARSKGLKLNVEYENKDTILTEWNIEISMSTGCWMTHYHEREGTPFTQTRPLSLTEDCEECIILPILFTSYQPVYNRAKGHDNGIFNIRRYLQAYLLPVFRKSPDRVGRYKAIGMYFLGREPIRRDTKTVGWNHSVGRDDIDPNQSPQEILNILFENNCHSVSEEFIIE